MFLDEQTITAIGYVLGQHFTEGQLAELADLIGHGAAACDYAAGDLDYRAGFERNHCGSEEDEYNDASEGYSDTSGKLAQLAQSIHAGELKGRD